VVKIVDEIYEEIKREDFFNRLRKFLPLIALGILSILSAAGIYSWYVHHQDKVLRKQEESYAKALENIKTGYLDQASDQLSGLVKKSSALRQLAMMQQAVIAQEEFKLTGQDKSREKARECYEKLLSLGPSIPLKNFFLALKALSESSFQSAFPEGALTVSSDSPWYSIDLMNKALQAYAQSLPSALNAFQQWADDKNLYSEALRWIATYCLSGVSAEYFHKTNNDR
jgi:type II secretory pathway pseudopilin PulG